MTGTLINVVTVLVGSALGLWMGGRMSERTHETVLNGLGMVTIALGLEMTLHTQNILIVMGSVLVGGLLGEWWRLERRMESAGAWLERRFGGGGDDASERQRFIQGFVTASLVYCVGPMAFLGSIQDGLDGNYRLLVIKSMLDGFASLAFASSLGVGVAFSVLPILIYQGSLSLLAAQANTFLTDAMIGEMTATGGILVMGIGIGSLLELKSIRIGNYLPALLLAPLIVWTLVAARSAGCAPALSDLVWLKSLLQCIQ
jgi:uncharacterized membrane protein YqgA involved in biofilm formation